MKSNCLGTGDSDIMNFVFGNRRYAELVRNSVEWYGQYNIDAFIVDEAYLLERDLTLPQIGIGELPSEKSTVFLGFTFENKKGPNFLESTAKRLINLGLELPGFDFSERPEQSENGIGTQIFQNSYIDLGCSLGRLVQVRSGVFIGHDTVIGDLTYIAPGVKVGSYVEVQEKCFLGFGCMVAPNSKIGHNSIIGTGSMVKGNIPPYSVVTADKPEGRVVPDPFRLL